MRIFLAWAEFARQHGAKLLAISFLVVSLIVATVACGDSAVVGTVELRVIDQAPANVSTIEVTVSRIEVHQLNVSEEEGWLTVIKGQKTFDLMKLQNMEQILGNSQLNAGSYTGIRMELVMVTIDGKIAAVSGDTLKVARRFTVPAGGTVTVLTLDFDAARSVVIQGDNVSFQPAVRLAVRQSSGTGKPPLYLQITQPQDGSTVGTAKITLEGITSRGATVEVNKEIRIEADEQGKFQINLPLKPGENLIEVIASTASGEEASRIIAVTLASG